ncbi:hypothetical protein AKJ09_08880 [Labilithrix luteola]|uniref:DUF4139 domain-containing protein n=1 Tax=Labilithrix luteola TaxID=1391654 RepID=A0A0K1Q983_9BACT|nr:DUF4139 domain-containing protein [Labilithrix luteola]AKV02217.1 hypothetical protein AKJ09_08880 [Labilithrix luteola]
MRKVFVCALALAGLGNVGCGQTTSYVKSETTLGRVVVYRNGVAYFERYADVEGDSLKLNVPQDKVDDFLKSLTVVDAKTGEPAPVSYPSVGSGGATIDMKVGASNAASGPRKLRLSYVTEAPSWKPSYRVVVGKDGKVEMQGWAIVDNTSGEDWTNVKLGVGASSAMSFRYDLKGLRLVQRETLRDNDLFAQAPPMGGASYGQQQGEPGKARVLVDFSDDVLANAQKKNDEEARSSRPKVATGGVNTGGSVERWADGGYPSNGGRRRAEPAQEPSVRAASPAPPPPPADPVARMAQSLQGNANTIVVEGYAAPGDSDKNSASLERANRLRDQLVRNGVDPSRIVALGKGEQQGRAGGARLVEAPTEAKPRDAGPGAKDDAGGKPNAEPALGEPVGTSHFESQTAMSVPRGTSAMVSILRSQTEGEVVYLYDPESPRGNTQYPFRTLRFRNPTDSALESGPVSVFGEGRFVGEGLADPIPAKAVAFVPFALDRQIVVERKDTEKDDIAKILTVQRGVFSTEIQHKKRATFTLYNRLPERATVYLRHSVQPGYKLTKAPANGEAGKKAEHLAGAHLFRVEIEPNGKSEVEIEEATPIYRSTDIRTSAGLDLVRAYISNAALDDGMKTQVKKLVDLNADMAKIEQQIATTHEQMAEYRARMDELHQQLFTLKAVKTAGPLMAHLEKKLQEMSEKLSKATIDVVSLQEKQMVARVQFQNGVGELTLEGKASDPDRAAKATASK